MGLFFCRFRRRLDLKKRHSRRQFPWIFLVVRGESGSWARLVKEKGEDAYAVWTMPSLLYIQGGKGEAHFVVWNVAAKPKAQDEILAKNSDWQDDGTLQFDEMWRRYVRGELDELIVRFPAIWAGEEVKFEATPEAVARAREMGFEELMRRMEELERQVPRGIVSDGEVVFYPGVKDYAFYLSYLGYGDKVKLSSDGEKIESGWYRDALYDLYLPGAVIGFDD